MSDKVEDMNLQTTFIQNGDAPMVKVYLEYR
uniref:Uncharacterized protein n=1 Tax=Tetranychus urticae TaxID=32264 RepID=T1L2Z5_TETUR